MSFCIAAASAVSRGECGGGHLADHVAHRLRRAGRLVGEHVGGVTRVAEQRRGALGTQLDELRDHRAIVGRTAEGAADRGTVDALAQRAILQPRQYRLVGGVLQRDEPLALQAAARGGLRRRADLLGRQSVEPRRRYPPPRRRRRWP